MTTRLGFWCDVVGAIEKPFKYNGKIVMTAEIVSLSYIQYVTGS